jgi:hypothetical protein
MYNGVAVYVQSASQTMQDLLDFVRGTLVLEHEIQVYK